MNFNTVLDRNERNEWFVDPDFLFVNHSSYVNKYSSKVIKIIWSFLNKFQQSADIFQRYSEFWNFVKSKPSNLMKCTTTPTFNTKYYFFIFYSKKTCFFVIVKLTFWYSHKKHGHKCKWYWTKQIILRLDRSPIFSARHCAIFRL